MTFSLHQGWMGSTRMGSQVKSDNTYNHQHRPLCPYTWHLRLDFQYLPRFYSLSQPHHVTVSHPSPGDNHQSRGGLSERTPGQAKTAEWNSFSCICTRAFTPHLFWDFETDCREWRTWLFYMVTGQDFFLSCPRYFFPHLFSSSYLLPLFHCLISILLFPCAGVWENTRAWVPHFL